MPRPRGAQADDDPFQQKLQTLLNASSPAHQEAPHAISAECLRLLLAGGRRRPGSTGKRSLILASSSTK